MKKLLFLAVAGTLCLALPRVVVAQASGGAGAVPGAFSYLTPDQFSELKTAFVAALSKNPDLALEWKEIGTEMQQPPASATDAEALRLKILGFEEELRGAMLKEDAGVGPLMDEVDKHMPKLHPELSTP